MPWEPPEVSEDQSPSSWSPPEVSGWAPPEVLRGPSELERRFGGLQAAPTFGSPEFAAQVQEGSGTPTELIGTPFDSPGFAFGPPDPLDVQMSALRAEEIPIASKLAARGAAGLEKGMTMPERAVRGVLDLVNYYPALDAVLGTGDKYQKQNADWLKYFNDRDQQLDRETKALGDAGFAGNVVEGVARGAVELPTQLLGGAAGAARGAAIKGAAITAGLTGGLSQYAQDRGAGRDKAESAAYGATSGLITGLTTAAFGATGVESIFKKEGVQGVGRRILEVLKQTGFEGAEESVDQFQQDLLERVTRNPDKPISHSVREILLAGTIGSLMGGAATGAAQLAGAAGSSRADATPEVEPSIEPTTPTEAEFIAGDRAQLVAQELQVNAQPTEPVTAAVPIKETAPLPTEVKAPDAISEAAKEIGTDVGAVGSPSVKQPADLENLPADVQAIYKELAARSPTTVELTDKRSGSPTRGLTINPKIDATKAEVVEMWNKAKEGYIPIEVDAINRLQPAVLIDGKPVNGNSHIEAALSVGTPEAIEAASKLENQGFTMDGKFISREQAAQMVGEKGKLTSERLTELREKQKKPPADLTPVKPAETPQPAKSKGQTDWEQRHGKPAEHGSHVRAQEDGSLLDADGAVIKPGEQISLSFLGGPTGMPRPWTLIKAENYFSSVNYKLNPKVTVRAANGVEKTYETANVYSPRKPKAEVAPPVKPAETPTKPTPTAAKEPVITTARQVNDAIFVHFDKRGGKVPTAAELTQQFKDAGHNVEFSEFAQDIGSAASDTVRFKGSAMDQSGASSSRVAESAFKSVFGQFEPIHGKTQAELNIPPAERLKRAVGTVSLPKPAVEAAKAEVSDWTSATEETPAVPSEPPKGAPPEEPPGIQYRHAGLPIPKFENRKMSPLDKVTTVHSGKLQKSTSEARRAQADIKREVPSERRQNAVTIWREANGDMAVLKDWETRAKQKWMRDAARDAQTVTPKEVALAQKVIGAFDVMEKRGNRFDVLKSHRDNYVPHIWDVKKPGTGWGGSMLKERFRFSKARTFNTFFDGDQAGFKPKTLAIGKMLPAYIHEMNTVIADRQMVQDLVRGTNPDGSPMAVPRGSVKADPSGNAVLVTPKTMKEADTADYRVMSDQPALSNWTWEGKDTDANPVFVKADLALHPDAYRRVNAMIGQSALRSWYRDPVSGTAQIPRAVIRGLDTAQMAMKREMFGLLAPFHQVQEGTHAVGHLVNPFFNIPKIDLRDAKQFDAANHGLMLLPDRPSAKVYLEGVGTKSSFTSRGIRKLGKPGEAMADVIDGYQDYLFHQYIPGLKLKTYEAMLKRNTKLYDAELKSGEMTPADVKITSAEQANAAYGHLNYALLDRNPTIQHFIQLAALAPDFLEARVRFAGQGVKGLSSKVGHEQMKAIAILAAAQAGTAVVLSSLLGVPYDPEHPFEVVYKGRRYAMRSVPEDAFALMKDTRKFVYARVNPLIGKGGVQLLTGLNYRGEKTTPLETVEELLAGYIPITARSLPGLRSLTQTSRNNSVTPLQQLAGSLGLRISRYSPISETYKLAGEWMEEQKLPKDRGSYPVSKYQQLRYALEDGDLERAREQYDELLKTMTAEQIGSGFKSSVNHPFTGSQANDLKFRNSLKGHDREKYDLALRTRTNILQAFAEARRMGRPTK